MAETNSLALHSSIIFDSFRSQGASTNTTSAKDSIPLDPRISKVVENIASVLNSCTDDGGALLTSLPSKAFTYIGGALLFKAANIKQISEIFEDTTSSESPHLDAVKWIREATGLSQKRISHLLGVSRMTLNLWERGENIADDNRRRLFAVQDVIKRAQKKYPTPSQLTAWLDTPRGSDGRTPADFIEAGEINRARTLAITTPSPKIGRPAPWVKQTVPSKFQKGAERLPNNVPLDNDDELFELYGDPGTDQDG